MLNLFNDILSNPSFFRQMRCGETLITMYNCPLEDKFVDVWSRYNYIVYVIEGRKIWHTSHGSYDLCKDVCVFVRKGAYIVEQFFEDRFCFVLFFVPDHFICDVLKSKSTPVHVSGKKYNSIIPIDTSAAIQTFFQSMMHYFNAQREPDPSLLELKFRELILTIADNPVNREVLSYFCSLLQEPQSVSLQRVMEENFCYNLKLEAFAKLSARSLSAFKRDFQRIYIGDESWTPFIGTPAHPECTSAHAALSCAAADVMQRLFGNIGPITDHTNDYLGHTPRTYRSFRAIGEEASLSRLYAGIHYQFSIDAGIMQGRKVAANIFSDSGSK